MGLIVVGVDRSAGAKEALRHAECPVVIVRASSKTWGERERS